VGDLAIVLLNFVDQTLILILGKFTSNHTEQRKYDGQYISAILFSNRVCLGESEAVTGNPIRAIAAMAVSSLQTDQLHR
jgi:hypothetical protein